MGCIHSTLITKTDEFNNIMGDEVKETNIEINNNDNNNTTVNNNNNNNDKANSIVKPNETTVKDEKKTSIWRELSTDSKMNIILREKREAKRRRDITSEKFTLSESFESATIEKSNETKKLLLESLKNNFLFSYISDDDMLLMVNAMKEKICNITDEIVIKKGDSGDYFYVVETGKYNILIDNEIINVVSTGATFGELALLYNSPRAATVICKTQGGKLWALDRITFRMLISKNVSRQINACKENLKNVPLLQGLTEDQFDTLADAVQLVTFSKGERIITKGEVGNILYILKKGSVICSDAGDTQQLGSLRLSEGDYFGERALLTNAPRAANVTAETDVTAMALDRQAFDELLGSFREVMDKNMGIRVLESVPILKTLSNKEREQLYKAFDTKIFSKGDYIMIEGNVGTTFCIIKKGKVKIFKKNENGTKEEIEILKEASYFGETALMTSQPYDIDAIAEETVECFMLDCNKFTELLGHLKDIITSEADLRRSQTNSRNKSIFSKRDSHHLIQLEDLEIIKTLGAGTFGRVKLVKNKINNSLYALKVLQKSQIVAFKQQENVINEKNILAMCSHPFILKLHGFFKDLNHLYLLLDFVQGGELFNYLHSFPTRKTEYLPNEQVMFYATNVLLALEYLHDRKIIYRDLKPENLLIDSKGYIKVVDFGFAKIVPKRTFTLCGTPEYLAPELVLGRGHGKAVDYWALGILIYEMAVGTSPFATLNSSDQMQICRNIVNGSITYPRWVKKPCRDLIDKLLTKDPSKRYGCTHNGINAIKNDKWFKGIKWDDIFNRKIAAPWLPSIQNEIDTSNFDETNLDPEKEYPYTDDGTNWDEDF